MTTQMEKEAFQAPSLIEKQLQQNALPLQKICKKLQKKKIFFIQTVARGSSSHAAHFAKYLFETKLKTITAPASLSIRTIYHASLHLKNSLVVAISQSGQSPDICEYINYAKKKGATTLAFVNDTTSPLADLAHFVIPLLAGSEKAVAATKSFLMSLSALSQFICYLSQDKKLLKSLHRLSSHLMQALQIDGKNFIANFQNTQKMFVIARGYGLPIAREAALKFKETAIIQAEAFSSAELMHGPIALVQKNYPMLFFIQKDKSQKDLEKIYQNIRALRAKPFLIAPIDCIKKPIKNSAIIALPKSLHPLCDPIVAIQAFYPLVARLAKKRKKNPDKPKNLQKVTKTI